MIRREASPSAGRIRSPSQGPQRIRSIVTFRAMGVWLVAASTQARIMSGVGFSGGWFWEVISRIAASCCRDIVVLRKKVCVAGHPRHLAFVQAQVWEQGGLIRTVATYARCGNGVF